MNQKGFAPVIIILIVVILCVGIVGGSYLVSHTFPNLISSADQSSVTDQTGDQPQTATASGKAQNPVNSNDPLKISSGKNKILSSVNGESYFISDFDGKNSKDVKEYLGTEYKAVQYLMASINNAKLLFSGSKVAIEEMSSLNSSESFNANVSYLLFDTQTEKVEKIDPVEIFRQFGQNVYYMPNGWSADGTKIVFSVISGDRTVKNPEVNIISYEQSTKKIQLLSKMTGEPEKAFYDSVKNFLVIGVYMDEGQKIRTVDTTNGTTHEYAGASFRNTSGLGNEFGPYYVKGDSELRRDVRELSIYPISGDVPNAIIKLKNPDQEFENGAYWSSGYSVTRIAVVNTKGKAVNSDFSSYVLNFYSPGGKLISSFDSEKKYTVGNKEVGLLAHDGRNLPFGVFSPDGKYYLAYGDAGIYKDNNVNSEPGIEIVTQLIDIESGQVLTEPVISDSRRAPLVWF